MVKYRGKNSTTRTQPPSPSRIASKKTSLGYVNIGLPSQYNVDDDDDDGLDWSIGGSGVRTVEEEFRLYAFGTLTDFEVLDTDLLKFWEVRYHSLDYDLNKFLPHSLDVTNSRQSFPSQWTTSLFRHHRFRLNAHFLLWLKVTHLVETASAPF